MELGRFIGVKAESTQGQSSGNRVRRNPLMRVVATLALCGVFVTSGIPFMSSNVAHASNADQPQYEDIHCLNEGITFYFKAPTQTSPTVTNYEYAYSTTQATSEPTSFTAFSPADATSPVSISWDALGLPSGVLHYFYLRAVFSDNTKSLSWYQIVNGGSTSTRHAGCTVSGSSAVVITGLPSRPLSGMTATPGDGSATVAFSPGSDGGSPITNYKYSIDGVTYIALSPASATSPITIPGLTNGVLTTIYLKAVNANGDSPSARAVQVTPVAATVAPVAPATTVAPTTTSSPSTKPDLVASSDSGYSDTDDITFDNTPTISVSERTNGYLVKVSAVKDSKTVFCTFVASPTVTSCALGKLTDGVWSVTSQQSKAGKTSPKSPVLKITIDTVAPIVTAFSTTAANGKKNAGEEVQIRATVNESIIPGGSVTATLDTKAKVVVTQTAATTMEGSYVVNVGDFSSDLTVDSFALKLAPTDIAGNVMKKTPIPQGQKNIGGAKNIVISGKATSAPVPTAPTTIAPAVPVAPVVDNNAPTVLECKTETSAKKSNAPVLVGEKLSDGIIFNADSPKLDATDKRELDRVANVMAQRGGLVLVSGFARKNGIDSAEYLKNLSLKRARNVSDYLVAKGVRVSMRYEGFGAVTKDIGTSVQRKVELRWLDDSDKTAYVKKCVTP
jgi:outer membrane protein OmpA-like peptidoglycan-associated protein